eukprot:6198826-Pleurochrysis_carterae.AAC.1
MACHGACERTGVTCDAGGCVLRGRVRGGEVCAEGADHEPQAAEGCAGQAAEARGRLQHLRRERRRPAQQEVGRGGQLECGRRAGRRHRRADQRCARHAHRMGRPGEAPGMTRRGGSFLCLQHGRRVRGVCEHARLRFCCGGR